MARSQHKPTSGRDVLEANRRAAGRVIALVSAAMLLLTATAFTAGAPAGGISSVRGFDGKTITTGGLGYAAQMSGADVGTEARFARANADNEVKGIKFKYTDFADDKADPATATSEARRLVTQEQVFAIVPNLSPVTPAPYLAQQHVPYFGWGFEPTYCSRKSTTKLWGFGFSGCVLPIGNTAPDSDAGLYTYVSTKTGKAHPTTVIISNDNAAGKSAARTVAASSAGAGFKVVFSKGNLPTEVSDYSPYVGKWMTAANGGPPDSVQCILSLQCLQIVDALHAKNYKGIINTGLYSDALVKPLKGTITASQYNSAPNPGLTQMKQDMEKVSPGTKVTGLNAATYFAADMFIQAVKQVAKKGASNITPEAVQKAAASQTWEIKGFAGPTHYPASTVVSSPACSTLLEDSDGTAWNVAAPYSCSSKVFKVKK